VLSPTYNGATAYRIARLNTDGTFDPSFAEGSGAGLGLVGLHVGAVVRRPDFRGWRFYDG
jgi:hypothetical protein